MIGFIIAAVLGYKRFSFWLFLSMVIIGSFLWTTGFTLFMNSRNASIGTTTPLGPALYLIALAIDLGFGMIGYWLGRFIGRNRNANVV
jgi:membrane protein DedA with SNARE-associated domain